MDARAPKTKPNRSQKPMSGRPNSFHTNVQEYMVNSTFHGLNYVGDTKLSTAERFSFVLAFLLVSALSTYYISIMWLKFQETPIIVANSATITSISEIPFPATTICNMNQARKSMAKDVQPGSFEDLQLKTLCMRNNEITKNHNFTSSWAVYKQFLLEMTQPCEEMLIKCKYGNQLMDCSKVFETVLTDDGLCCTFNQVHPKFIQQNYRIEDDFDMHDDGDNQPIDWDPENGYGNQILTKNTYPRVAPGPGSSLGLTLVLYSNYDDYYCSSTNSAGFKLLLHNPIDTPLVENFGLLIRTGHHSRLVITPNVPSASHLIRSISKNRRQCMFSSEANLTYFRSYTKKNCELECKSRTIVKECGCVLYYMPRLSQSTKICSQEDAHCYEKIKLAVESSYNDTFSCNCIPGCFSMSYAGQISMNRFNVSGRIKEPALLRYSSQFLRNNIAMIDIFYDDNVTRKNIKSQFVGFTDFLSGKIFNFFMDVRLILERCGFFRVLMLILNNSEGIGGLLSLFMGFSFISIIEIVYYATLRPFYKSKRLRAERNMQVTIGEPKTTWKYLLKMDN